MHSLNVINDDDDEDDDVADENDGIYMYCTVHME